MWDSTEEEILSEYYGTLSVSEIQNRFLPDRSYDAITGKAYRMQLTDKPQKTGNPKKIENPRFRESDLAKIRGREDPERILDAMMEYQRETHKMSTNFQEIPIYLDVDKPVALAFTSDEHIGAHTTHYDKLINFVRLVNRTPYLYVMEIGDKIDNYLKGHIPEGMYEAIAPPEVQKLLAEHIFGKLDGRLLAMWQGCHDEFSHRADDFDVTKWLAKELNVANMGHEGYVDLHVGGQVYTIGARHKYKYTSSFNRTHKVKRFRQMKKDFDVGVIAHHHQSTFEHLTCDDGIDRVFVRPGSFKGSDRYSRQKGYTYTVPRVPTVVLYPGRREMMPFLKLSSACRYMEATYGGLLDE